MESHDLRGSQHCKKKKGGQLCAVLLKSQGEDREVTTDSRNREVSGLLKSSFSIRSIERGSQIGEG